MQFNEIDFYNTIMHYTYTRLTAPSGDSYVSCYKRIPEKCAFNVMHLWRYHTKIGCLQFLFSFFSSYIYFALS